MSKVKAHTAASAVGTPATAAAPAEATVSQAISFRDKVFTSRTLILPGGAPMVVDSGCVTVEASNAEALELLLEHDDFEPLE